MKNLLISLCVVALALSLGSCAESPASDVVAKGDGHGEVLATVNGVPITEYDLRELLRRSPHGEESRGGDTGVPLQTLVRAEVVAQEAHRLGLDRDPAYRATLGEAEAQLRALRRERLAALFRGYVDARSAVSDSEAADYFERNADRIRSRVRVWQIFHRGARGPIEQDRRDLEAGVPFERVAARRFPDLPAGVNAPWDLGYLHWNQLPESWRETVDRLGLGKVSDVIEGEGGRTWIIKVVDRKIDPAVTFDTERARLVAFLTKQKRDRLYDELLVRAREDAEVVLSDHPPSESPGE